MITVIGYDGRPLSDSARAAVDEADLVVGGARHLQAVAPTCETVLMGPVASALEAIATAHAGGRKAVVLASGDPGFFGITRRLRATGLPFTAEPAVSSVATAFARLGLPWDEALVVSAHGRPVRPALNALLRFGHSNRPVAVLTEPSSSPARLVEALGEHCPDLHVLERLGEADERITLVSDTQTGALSRADAITHDWREPNVVVAGGNGDLDEHPWRTSDLGADGWALPDEAFEHRDGMLTKRDVRAAVLARLAPGVGRLVWDVGAGSGSVAVECARLGSAAIAVEQDPEQLERIAANAARHQVPVRVVNGKAPEALDGLPHPDAVFVGGGGPEVVSAVAAVQAERVVVALATLERVGPTVTALDGYEVETVLLQVQHLSPLGDGHRLAPANPVFVVSGVRA
jgi:precorrin-6Y C5,15-methyltransferase (decarboxylating)